MRIAVASGKGGTGKTMAAVSLALTAARSRSVRLLDCDVEAPNAALFLHPQMSEYKEVGLLLPSVDDSKCSRCGRCAEVCEFHAMALVGGRATLFPELCHGCGSCARLCPEGAISEALAVTGVLERGSTTSALEVAQGELRIGHTMAAPIIRSLKHWMGSEGNRLEIRDAPPGASCPLVETIRGTDFVFFVTEPTPFGLHDLQQVAEVVRELQIPAAVIVNRDGIGNQAVDAYCAERGLPIVLRIPMQRRIAKALGRGATLLDAVPEYRSAFEKILDYALSTA